MSFFVDFDDVVSRRYESFEFVCCNSRFLDISVDVSQGRFLVAVVEDAVEDNVEENIRGVAVTY